ncbi:MAG TPA: hypothetical protein VIL12_01115 [Acidimicrobiia bacterium]
MGIEIPRHVAKAAGIPEDLDSSGGGHYRFPSPSRRRIAGVVYGIGALGAGLGAALGLPSGMWAVAAGLAALAFYHFITAWDVGVDETQALRAAGREVGFPVGHASATLRFEGVRSRPVWGVLLYSADDPPSRRALVRIDATAGRLLGEPYEEPIAPV